MYFLFLNSLIYLNLITVVLLIVLGKLSLTPFIENKILSDRKGSSSHSFFFSFVEATERNVHYIIKVYFVLLY